MLRRTWTWTRDHPLTTAAWLAIALVILVGYAAVHGRLLIHQTDDAWSTSFAWQYIRHGIVEDVIFRAPGTMPLLFGKTHAVALALVGEPFGWTRSHMHLVSTAAILGNGAVWYGIGRGVGLQREAAVVLGVSLVLFQPLVLAANIARPDALTLLLASLSVLALVRQRFFLAGLAAAVAVETHPMGVMGAVYGLAYALTARRTLFPDAWTTRGRLGALAAGVALGMLWFLASNRAVLSLENLQTLWAATRTFGQNTRASWSYLHEAFAKHGYVELAVFAAALALYLWRAETRRDPLALAWLAAVVVSAVLIRRQNAYYVIHAFPAFAFLAVRAFAWRPVVLRLASAALVASFALRCGKTWHERRTIDFEATLRQVVAAVPDDGLPVVGLTDYWFGFQERRFVPVAYKGDFDRLGPRAFYFVDSTLVTTRPSQLLFQPRRYRTVKEIARFADSATTTVRVVLVRRSARSTIPRGAGAVGAR